MAAAAAISAAVLLSVISHVRCKPGESQKTASAVDTDTTRFKLVASEVSGLVFSNQITESFDNNILINSYLYNGGGVAVLDVNKDGLPDLYFSATQEPNRLFLNKGGLVFEDITDRAGVGAAEGIKTGVTVVDINSDGWPDLYVCRSGMQATAERANLLYVNNGDLTFSEQGAAYGLDNRSASNHANFFDYDLDGDLDLYLLNHPVSFKEVNKITARQEGNDYIRIADPRDEWESDKLFRNEGDGHFTEVSGAAGIRNRAWGLSATVTDFNRDGYPDLFVANDYIEPDIVYINDRKGGFSNQTDRYFRHLSNHTMGVDIADLNNDGLVDLIGLDMIAEDNQRQKELMTTMLLERYNNLVRFHYGHQLMRNVLQLNTGAAPDEHGAPFMDIGELAGVSNTDWSWSPLLADFDNDGRKDLYITNGYRRDISNLDYLNYTVDSIMQSGGVSTARFQSIDEYLRLIPSTPLQNYMFRNINGWQFEKVSDDWGLVERSYANGSAFADLDNDGDLEVVVNQIHGNVLLYENRTADRQENQWLQVKLEGSAGNTQGVGAKVRVYCGSDMQYQELTPVRGFFSSSSTVLHFGLGRRTVADRVEVRWPTGNLVQTLTDVPAGQRLTVRIGDARPGPSPEPKADSQPLFTRTDVPGLAFLHREDDFIDFNRERLLPHKFSDRGPCLAKGDVNRDGREDLYFGGARGQAGALFLQQQNSTFRQVGDDTWAPDATYEDLGATFLDADGDGDLDLYVVSGGNSYDAGSSNYQDRLYLNDGAGGFLRAGEQVLPVINSSGGCVSSTDMDGDGDPDLFRGGLVTPGRYPEPPVSYLLEQDGGKFKDICSDVAPALRQGGMINESCWADLDGDGREELVLAGEWMPITVFRWKDGRLTDATADFGLSDTQGWWNCILAEDFDQDGDLDLVAGNLGLNCRLEAHPDEPLQLFAKDFDGNGSLDPILAYHNQGAVYPLPLRDNLIKQLPPLKKKFVRHRAYGQATLEEVFSNTQLSTAQQFRANTFASTYFENDKGTFRLVPLPIQAQVAPVNALLADDFNGDGTLDILLAGNSNSPEVETGRIDAGNGLLLLGDGTGGFTPMEGKESGFWALGVVRDMIRLELSDGTRIVVLARNDDSLTVFRY
ncbi:MAG: hypothetical protein RLY31_521 [Bacteroidota bacterium]|jgi:hypothetical protein